MRRVKGSTAGTTSSSNSRKARRGYFPCSAFPFEGESMATFPDEVLTRTKKGEVEVRSLIDRGRYVRYHYLHPETGEQMEGGKVKLVLIADGGKTDEYFILPTKSKRDLLIPAAEKGARKVWDGTQAVEL